MGGFKLKVSQAVLRVSIVYLVVLLNFIEHGSEICIFEASFWLYFIGFQKILPILGKLIYESRKYLYKCFVGFKSFVYSRIELLDLIFF